MDSTAKTPTNWVGFTLIILFIIFIVGLVTYLYFNGGLKNLTGSDPIRTKTNADLEAQVSITETSFVPETLTIKKGTTVTWVNNGEVPHQPASDPHPTHTLLPELGSGEPLAKGDIFSFTFSKAGTFTYHDHLNPLKFKGIVIVQ